MKGKMSKQRNEKEKERVMNKRIPDIRSRDPRDENHDAENHLGQTRERKPLGYNEGEVLVHVNIRKTSQIGKKGKENKEMKGKRKIA